MRTALTKLMGIEHPLVALNRSPGVVAAVTNAGGLGVLAATSYSAQQLDAQLHWIDEQVNGKPYGVDVLVPERVTSGDPGDLIASLRRRIPAQHERFIESLLDKYQIPSLDEEGAGRSNQVATTLQPHGTDDLVEVALAHQIALIANALGPPPPQLLSRAQEAGVLVAALVGQPRHAVRQIKAGVDVLIAQGTEAGGHTGTIATMVLTPEIVDLAGDRPVLSAGGIASGRQMAAALALGAAGVWCGSVWLSSIEDITPETTKQKFLEASSSDTVRSPTRTGKPARQLRSAWHDEWDLPDSPSALPMPLQALLVGEAWRRIEAAAVTGHTGAAALESFYIGQVVGTFRRLRPAGEIARQIVTECEQRLAELAAIR